METLESMQIVENENVESLFDNVFLTWNLYRCVQIIEKSVLRRLHLGLPVFLARIKNLKGLHNVVQKAAECLYKETGIIATDEEKEAALTRIASRILYEARGAYDMDKANENGHF